MKNDKGQVIDENFILKAHDISLMSKGIWILSVRKDTRSQNNDAKQIRS